MKTNKRQISKKQDFRVGFRDFWTTSSKRMHWRWSQEAGASFSHFSLSYLISEFLKSTSTSRFSYFITLMRNLSKEQVESLIIKMRFQYQSTHDLIYGCMPYSTIGAIVKRSSTFCRNICNKYLYFQ